MQDFLTNAIVSPLENLLAEIYAFLPNIFAMILILIIGAIVVFILKFVLNLFLKLIRFDKICFRLGFANVLSKAGMRLKPSEFVVKIIYWLLLFIFVMLAFNALKIKALDTLITQFFLFLPNIIAGIILFFAGYLISILLERAVLIAAVNAEIQFAKVVSRGVQILVLLFFLAIALEQVGIGESIVTASFTIIFGGLVLAVALALGLGGRELGKAWLEKHFGKQVSANGEENKNMWSHL
ncbi:MAG: hypothetical protein AMS23_00560 [Bacteroides sp. SM1_62]|nr:MAG: hypothetical protein AMS26_01115 [Bacteroides sp. SM23_62]KPL26729.1 MAG: hypothetical protein AMS23_00560 [Bacteroides sp. SM1_62]